ncbi:MAG: hypothetical protein SNJ67_06585 [Chloracidobacterium sp.]|uniref:DUF302 domain-containing protein n=1 Tax=Chloracidobacterium validum TaxID=2821543 RepID=A0ABX8BCP7_9BACT|nr:hypothetical protein [Chloracidobacterium validum]QUW03418.1 hypothetical protein J8C06_02985 [Chloracidobacterium validum]
MLLRVFAFLALFASVGFAAQAQVVDRAALRDWQGRYPHHEVKGPRGRKQTVSFFKLPAVRGPLADLLGPPFLDGVEEGDYLEEKIELIGDYLVIRLYPNLRRIEDERNLIIIVPLGNPGLHAVYYQQEPTPDGQLSIQTDWKHSAGTSLDDLPKSLKVALATMMGFP